MNEIYLQMAYSRGFDAGYLAGVLTLAAVLLLTIPLFFEGFWTRKAKK